MTSADFWNAFHGPRSPCSRLLRHRSRTPPGNAHPPSRLCLPHLHDRFLCKHSTLEFFASESRTFAISPNMIQGEGDAEAHGEEPGEEQSQHVGKEVSADKCGKWGVPQSVPSEITS